MLPHPLIDGETGGSEGITLAGERRAQKDGEPVPREWERLTSRRATKAALLIGAAGSNHLHAVHLQSWAAARTRAARLIQTAGDLHLMANVRRQLAVVGVELVARGRR